LPSIERLRNFKTKGGAATSVPQGREG